jgi:hypothetical protein
MKKLQRKVPLVLGIALYTRGFGFALMHGGQIVNWGTTKPEPREDTSQWSVKRLKSLISQWKPDAVVFEDSLAEDSLLGPRLRRLAKQMMTTAQKRGLVVKSISRTRLAQSVTGNENATKYEIAETILKQFPNELTAWLPPKRKAWMRENPKLRVFDAVALGMSASNAYSTRK